ncbi:hypothetical protein B5F40_03275 [Gordonibacter sp. An230]|uniref:hypothetical protein n=1 Tax=Gordonibacter sp. An230 TaxID=1965592 RepID=UPI000B37797D|nr:hypothetical protein [Gordonibacter sp. An230]OUO91473.1 hypothetical protein B5F40_03275 [Gordonibacter sp. An230]
MEATVAAFAATLIVLAVFAIMGVMLWRGSWLALLVDDASCSEEDASSCRALGRRMAVVLAVCCALMATLVLFLAARLAGAHDLASIATMANNAAFLAFVVALAWFFVVQRPNRPEGVEDAVSRRARTARLDHLHTRTIVFVVAVIVAVIAVGMLAALA